MAAARPNWLKGSPIAIAGQPNALPKNLRMYTPKYVLESPMITEEHVQQFKSALTTLRVEHEDIACALFPASFDKHGN